jgi:hypothetical protein
MAKRGQLTPAIKAKGLELLGKEITPLELRLMPYAQYCLVNGENIDPRKVNQEEREILQEWRDYGFISGGAVDFQVTEKFWNAVHALLWLAYVAYPSQPDE